MSALGLLSPEECLWKYKLEELDSQIKALNPDSPDCDIDRIKTCAFKGIELLESYRPTIGEPISSLISRCHMLESSLIPLELTCLQANKNHYFSKNSRKPQNNVIKKIHEIMSEVLFYIAINRIHNVKKVGRVSDFLSKTPHQRMLQIAITSTSDYQHTNLERKLELLSRTIDLLGIIPKKRQTLDVFKAYAKATCCMTKDEFEGMLESIQAYKGKDCLEIAYSCIALFDLDSSESSESRKIKLLEDIREGEIIIFKMISSQDDASAIDLLKKAKIDLHLVNSYGDTLLHSFAQIGRIEMLSSLVEMKANPKIRSNSGYTPYMELRQREFPIPEEIPSDELGYLLKMAALIWGLEGKVRLHDGSEFMFELGNIEAPLAQYISDIFFLDPAIKAAFSKATKKRPINDLIRDIQGGLLTVIPAGFRGHSLTLVFYQDLLLVCNRGGGAIKEKCLLCFRIDLKKVDEEIIESIQDCKNKIMDQALPFYYEELPRLLSPVGIINDITSEFYELQSKFQEVGNCAAASMKLAIRACLAAISFKKNDDSLPSKIADSIWLDSKNATKHLRKVSYERLKNELLRIPKKVAKRILAFFEEKRFKYGIER